MTTARPTYGTLQSKMRDMLSAHDKIAEGIATHAEKHEAALDARRQAARHQQRIAEGMAAHASQVHGTTQAS